MAQELSPTIKALLHEREGYATRGLDARVAEVDKALAEAGYGRGSKSRRETATKPASEKRG